MNTRLQKTLESLTRKAENEDAYFIDAYNGRWDAQVSGTILTGIDFRCMYFIMEYETDKDR